MLPRGLYELLPYLYLAAGIAGGLLIDTSLIIIGSMLLISAGLLTLYMRYQYRINHLEVTGDAADRRTGSDRRQHKVLNFPVMDSTGQLVMADRRKGDRRDLMQHSFG